MPHSQLADFLSALHDSDDLKRIDAEVDAEYELAAIVDSVVQLSADGGPAILFENVRGCSIPVVANLLGASRRMNRALSSETFDDAAGRLLSALMPEVPDGWGGALKLVPRLSQLGGIPPRVVKTGASQQVVRLGVDVDLGELPIPLFWPGESGRTITAGQVHLVDPSTGVRQMSRQRVEILDANSVAIHWSPHDPAYHAHRAYAEEGQQTPVAIVLGGDPLLTYGADAPVPAGNDPLLLVGLLAGQGVDLVRGRTIGFEVPADAEFVIEGFIAPDDPGEQGGAVASDMGYLTESRGLPRLEVSAVTHRANPVLPVIVPMRTPAEEQVFQKVTERLLLPFLRLFLSEVIDIHRPAACGGERMLFISIRKQFPGQAQRVIDAAAGLEALSAAKTIVVVDESVDVQNASQVWAAVAANVAAQRDVRVSPRPADADDPAGEVQGCAARLSIDATRKTSAEADVPTRKCVAIPSAELLERIHSRHSRHAADGVDSRPGIVTS